MASIVTDHHLNMTTTRMKLTGLTTLLDGKEVPIVTLTPSKTPTMEVCGGMSQVEADELKRMGRQDGFVIANLKWPRVSDNS